MSSGNLQRPQWHRVLPGLRHRALVPQRHDAQVLAAQATIPATVAQIRSDLNNYYTLSNVSEMQIFVTESGPGASAAFSRFSLPRTSISPGLKTAKRNGRMPPEPQDRTR